MQMATFRTLRNFSSSRATAEAGTSAVATSTTEQELWRSFAFRVANRRSHSVNWPISTATPGTTVPAGRKMARENSHWDRAVAASVLPPRNPQTRQGR